MRIPITCFAVLVTACSTPKTSDASATAVPTQSAIPAAASEPSASATQAAQPTSTPAAQASVAPARTRPGTNRKLPAAERLAALVAREPTIAETDARAHAAFAALTDVEKREVVDWFESECRKLDTLQTRLLRYVVDNAERERMSWPEVAALPWFDPKVHAAAQPIARYPLAADAPEVVAVRNRILGAAGSRRLDGGWIYDYSAREPRRLPRANDPNRIFDNGLLGLAPGWDYAEVLVEQKLDDGRLEKSYEAFGNAYTDRWGGVYPGITLYDAHAARAQIEMPDVDCLGIIHHVLDDWKTWTSVVPNEAHDALYGRIHELFTDAFRYRSLRTNIARTYLCGTTELRDQFQHNLTNFHALWESVSSDPATLAQQLPDAKGAWDFLQQWHERIMSETDLWNRGLNRRAVLDDDTCRVRQTLLGVLEQYGAFERVEKLPQYDGE